MASLRKRNGKWQVQVRRHGATSVSKSFLMKADALKWGREMEIEVESGRHGQGALEGTLADLIKRYMAEVTPRKRSASHERNRLERLLRHPIANIDLAALKPKDVAAFRDERLERVGAQAVRHDLNILSNLLTVAQIEWDVPLPVNPVSLIRKPRQPASRERRLSREEWAKLVEALSRSENPRFRAAVRLAVETAMRQGELLAMRWEHVDWEPRIVRVPMSKNGRPRHVPLTPAAVELLKALGDAKRGPVLGLSVAAVRGCWDRVVRRAKLADLHFHDLRHEAVSRFFEIGLSVPEVALISGHRDVRMLHRYTHLRVSEVAQKISGPKMTATA